MVPAYDAERSNFQMDNHRASLSILVRLLKDSSTADAYCTLGGEVIPSKVAMEIGQRLDIIPWAQLVLSGSASDAAAVGSEVPSGLKRSISEEKKRELLGMLMRVYMEGG